MTMSIPVRGLAIVIGIVALPLAVILISLAASQSPGAPEVGEREPIRISGGSDIQRGSLDQQADETTEPPSTDRDDVPPPVEDREQATAQVPEVQPHPPSTAGDGPSQARSDQQTTRQVRPPVQTRPAPPDTDNAGDDDDVDGDDDDWGDDDDEDDDD